MCSSMNTNLVALPSELVLLPQGSHISRKSLDPLVVVDKQLNGDVVVPENDGVHMSEVVPSKVNCNLAVCVAKGLELLLYNLIVTPDSLRLEHEARVPLAYILIDHQHL